MAFHSPNKTTDGDDLFTHFWTVVDAHLQPFYSAWCKMCTQAQMTAWYGAERWERGSWCEAPYHGQSVCVIVKLSWSSVCSLSLSSGVTLFVDFNSSSHTRSHIHTRQLTWKQYLLLSAHTDAHTPTHMDIQELPILSWWLANECECTVTASLPGRNGKLLLHQTGQQMDLWGI